MPTLGCVCEADCFPLERQALRWVQKYIDAFGGDPSRVTMSVLVSLSIENCANRRRESWGESAGAMSVALHMVANGGNTEGLFHGAFMESGAVIPSGDVTVLQQDYDDLVRGAGCAGATDTLECLRQLPFQKFKEAVNEAASFWSYLVRHGFLDQLSTVVNYLLQSPDIPWFPRADGTFIKAPPQQLVLQDCVANIPFVTGNGNVKFRGSSLTGRPRQLRRRRNTFKLRQSQRYVSRVVDMK